MKIKRADGTFVQWYRVRDGNVIGWQGKRPDGYRDVPYIGAVDPFDPELAGDTIFWPEGERLRHPRQHQYAGVYVRWCRRRPARQCPRICCQPAYCDFG